MEENSKMESGFRIINLILLESNFSRVANVAFNKPEIHNEVDVDVNVKIKEKTVVVTESLFFKQKYEGQEQVNCTIKMVGVFEKIGDTELDLEEFGHINAAAIIFPYIREHLTGLAVKAGLGVILLPPVNFTKKHSN
ncbi:MAG: protein-export chaperone SecB [Cyclobacteriaceae bacterium]